jgi:Protein  of unknown function (DUF3018)
MPRKPRSTHFQPSAKEPHATASRGQPSRVKGLPAKSARSKSSRDKVKAYRERMRKRGMKLVQVWVPDPESPYFADEARRQARLIVESSREREDQAFIDSLSEWKPD